VQHTVCAVQRRENALKLLGNTVELAEYIVAISEYAVGEET
jgi:hypothetical protein